MFVTFARTAFKNISLILPLFLSLIIFSPLVLADGPSLTIYKEPFGFCDGSVGNAATAQTKWAAMVSGLPLGKPGSLKVFSYGSEKIGGAVNSLPIGGAQGFAFWSREVEGLLIFTSEFFFDVSLLDSVEFEQRLSSSTDKTKLALLVDDNWFISDRAVSQSDKDQGDWQLVQFKPFSETYGVTPFLKTVGPSVPDNFGQQLPISGTVRAFGVFLHKVSNRVRIDNFKINGVLPSGSGISTAVQGPDLEKCRVTPVAGTPTPDAEATPQFFSTPTPAPTPVDIKSLKFCPITEQGAGKRVVASSKALRALLKLSKTPNGIDLRDAAIVSILATYGLPVGALVNVKVGDYYPSTGHLVIGAKSGALVKVKLSKKPRNLLNRYILELRTSAVSAEPLFVSAQAKIKAIQADTAACLSEINAMIKAKAKINKVKSQVSFVRVTR